MNEIIGNGIIDIWDNLDVKKWSVMELKYLRMKSYYRYNPPNEHMLYMVLALILIVFSSWFFAMHMHWLDGITIHMDEFPKYHKTGFWWCETIAFFGGLAILPYWWKLEKISRKNWKEMQAIRKRIDDELKTR